MRSPSFWQKLKWGLTTRPATGSHLSLPAVHRAPANFQPMWPRFHPRQFELILCMKFGGMQCQMFNWNQDANFPSSTRSVNPVKNKIKAIKLVWQHLSFMHQVIHCSWFPQPLPARLPPPTPYLFCSVYGPWAGQHTVSSTDFAKSKMPFRDLFYLKSTPLMGLMAFQSLSMHCQWGRIDFLRIPVLGGKQTAFPSPCSLASEQMRVQDTVWAGAVPAAGCGTEGTPLSLLSGYNCPRGHIALWTLDEADCCSHKRSIPGLMPPSLGKNQTTTLGALRDPLGPQEQTAKDSGPARAPQTQTFRRALPLCSLEFQNLAAMSRHITSHWGNY